MGTSITDYLAGQKPSTNTVSASTVTDGSKTAAGKASLADSYQTFLTLLTSQLKNQDPLSPMETTQFTQQLVQMTGVEQQLLSNDLLQSLVNQSTSGSNLNAVGLIGKTVTASTADANLKDGAAKWTYAFDAAPASAKVEVLDSKGKTVWSGAAPSLDTGEHDFAWDGKSTAGVQQPDGVYTLKITALDSSNAAVTASTYFTGAATALDHTGTDTLLRIGGVKVPLASITSVRDPGVEA